MYNPELAKTIVNKLTPTLCYRCYDFSVMQPRVDPYLIKIEKFFKREVELCGPYALPEQMTPPSIVAPQTKTQRINNVTEKTHIPISKKRRQEPSGISHATRLGTPWKPDTKLRTEHRFRVTHREDPDENLKDLVKRYFEMDALCIKPKRPKTDPEEQTLRILERTTTNIEEGRFQTGLLWRKDDFKLPDNYKNSLKRLFNIEKKIDRDSTLKKKYVDQMDALIAKGYAEPAPKPDRRRNEFWVLSGRSTQTNSPSTSI
ncbi:unnamed protein product [Parnassius mnemosyne]|uniref:Uncharacterized protein n=1 Tax=Parnassius mnemosyne TaxID=213953 RepID=A0AAV1KA28_9NEOP